MTLADLYTEYAQTRMQIDDLVQAAQQAQQQAQELGSRLTVMRQKIAAEERRMAQSERIQCELEAEKKREQESVAAPPEGSNDSSQQE